MMERRWLSKARSIACGLSIFGLLAACTHQSASKPEDLVELPQRENGIENVEVHREGAFLIGSTTLIYITVNGKDIWALGARESVKFGLAEGHYNIGARCMKTDGIFAKWRHNEVSVEVAAKAVDIYVSYLACNVRI
jgi:hypothetical protein